MDSQTTMTTEIPVAVTPAESPTPAVDEQEKAILARIESRQESLRSSADYYRRRADEELAKVDGVGAKVRELFAVKAALEMAGFAVRLSSWCDELYLDDITDRRLIDLARVVGVMTEGGRSLVDPEGPKQRPKFVRVTLTSKKYPFVYATYQTRLKPGAKCKVVTEIKRERKLVCDLT